MPPDRDPLVCHDARTGRSVFIAPRRGDRPGDTDLAVSEAGGPADWCPFCAGNESRTPPSLLRAPADPASPWRARIIPNRYPFVEEAAAAAAGEACPAHGVHDVVIESPHHDTAITAIDPTTWQDGWGLVQQRLADLAGRPDLAWGTVFKNSGLRAGASLEHVHSQIVAVDFLPPAVRAEFTAAGLRADPFADLLAEAAAERRIVFEQGGLVAFVPAAARQPFETWIVPAAREPHFHAASPSRAAALAACTRRVVAQLAEVLPGVDFNWWLHEAAWDGLLAVESPSDRWHWHLEILPRAAELAGFELGTGCHITALHPVEAAARLRDG